MNDRPPLRPPVPIPLPPANQITPSPGGLQFSDAAPMICSVVDNGVCSDDPRVLVRLNEATKIILDNMIPVGGMCTANVAAFNTILVLPPEMENVIEAIPFDSITEIRNDTDITQGWYEIVNNSVYLDPNSHHDNPLVDYGLWPDKATGLLRRAYSFPGLDPLSAIVTVTGAKRFVPLTNDEDYLIVQNIEAIKLIILSIERFENNDVQGGTTYRQEGLKLLEAEVKKHILDPRNYMRRMSSYYDDLIIFPENTLGWVRANIALDVAEGMKVGKDRLSWSINQCERRIMKRAIYKDMVTNLQADVVGGVVYFPIFVQSVLAVDLDGSPIPIRSHFFEHQQNGPGMFSCNNVLIDQGDEYFPATRTTRRKYKLIADCANSTCLNAVCLLRWVIKKPGDIMTIKNYEAIRLMMTAKFLEDKEDWQNAQVNQQQAFKLMDEELQDFLRGILHTVHVQSYGFGLGDVGSFWAQ